MQSLNVQTSGISMRPTLVATVIEDGAVLLDLESKYFYSLNGCAWAIVQLFENQGSSVETILECCRRWGAQDESAVHGFMDKLRGYGLVEECDATAPAPPVTFEGPWQPPAIERQREPLQSIVTSAFDPSVPLAE